MEKLKSYEFRNGSGQYDWDTILDGSIYRLVPGEDFTCSAKSFNQMARNQAKRMGGKAKVSEEKDESGEITGLVVQYREGGA